MFAISVCDFSAISKDVSRNSCDCKTAISNRSEIAAICDCDCKGSKVVGSSMDFPATPLWIVGSLRKYPAMRHGSLEALGNHRGCAVSRGKLYGLPSDALVDREKLQEIVCIAS